jgi:hypothetical protein
MSSRAPCPNRALGQNHRARTKEVKTCYRLWLSAFLPHSGNRRLTARLFALAAVVAISLLVAGSWAGRFLVIDAPEPSDVLIVLAGDRDDIRYKRGLQLLADGYGPRMLVDASSETLASGYSAAELEPEFISCTAGPLRDRIGVCPVRGVSTQEEAQDISHCLDRSVSRVLLVTSDHHSRRALLVLRHALPQYHWSVASVNDDSGFRAEHWWQRRESAKTTVLEWSKFAWWEVVERWRNLRKRKVD